MKFRVVRCDNCGKVWEEKSPPAKESYENMGVEVESLSIFLPESIVLANEKAHKGQLSSHLFSLRDKDYCSLKCFLDAISDGIGKKIKV